MKTLNTRAMMEGAILSALTAIMGIFYNIPILNALTFFWPVPIIIIGYRHGFKVSILSSIVASVIVSWITTPVTGLILLITYALPGAVMGMLMRKKINLYLNLLICGLILAIAAVLEFVLGLQLTLGKGLMEIVGNFSGTMNDLYQQFYNQFLSAVEIYRKLGFDEATIQQIIKSFEAMVQMAKIILPTSVVLMGILAAIINYKVVRLILNKIGYSIEDIKRFQEWRLDRKARVIVLVLTLAVLGMMSLKVKELYYVYINIWLVLMVVYAVLGLSIAAYFIEKVGIKHEIPRPLLGIALVLVLLFFISVLPYIGMFDVVADIRRLNNNTIGGLK